MALFDDASLVVTPNGYKEGTLYSIKPTSGLGDMTVVRATTATRVNSAGLIELVPYNLLQQSETFTNAIWTNSNLAITTNTIIAPNGTTTADTFTENSTSTSQYRIYQTAPQSTNIYTISVYVKNITGTRQAYIDLGPVTGFFNFASETTYSASGIASFENVGNGWYRFSLTTATAITPSTIYMGLGQSNSETYTGNGTSAIAFWGAQLNIGSTAKDYLRTETRLNIPRLDYSNGSCPSLLVEPQRTNLLTYSSSFDNSGAWTAQTTSVSANATTAPDGTTSAETLTPSGSVAYDNRVYQTQTVTGGAVYTMSVWAKSSASNAKLTLGLQNHGGQVFNITDQWERYSVAVTALDTYGNFNIYAGDVTPTTGTINSSNVVTIWGAQLEVGSYPTSYIPTTSAAVTRNADVISKTGISSLIGQTEGVVFMDINWQQKDGVYFINSISDGTTDNEIMMAFGSTDNNRLRFSIVNGGSASVSFDSTALASGRYKVAFAYANNDAVAYINGTQVFTDNTVSVPSTSEMKFLRANNTLGYSGTINASALWKTRLTNAELISLTTI